MAERTRRAEQISIGAALLLAPWLDDLLRWLGALGDAKELGGMVLGMPPEFLWMLIQWVSSTAGLALIFASVAHPVGRAFVSWKKRPPKRDALNVLMSNHPAYFLSSIELMNGAARLRQGDHYELLQVGIARRISSPGHMAEYGTYELTRRGKIAVKKYLAQHSEELEAIVESFDD